MGNEQSQTPYPKQPKNSLTIALEKEFFYPGEELKGELWLSLTEPLQAYNVEIILQLQEMWFYQEKKKNPHQDSNMENLIKKNFDLKNYLVLNEDMYLLMPGKYSFPFEMILPSFLQPVFDYPVNFRRSSLRYVLFARVLSPRGEGYHISSELYIQIRSRPLVLGSPLSFSSCVNIHSWGIFEQGTTILNASYPRNNYTPGKNIEIKVVVDNTRGKLMVTSLKFVLMRKIQLWSVYIGNRFLFEDQLAVQYVKPQCPPGGTTTHLTIIPLKDSQIMIDCYKITNTPYPHLVKDKANIIFLLPSLNSALIKCDYYIKISAYFDSFVSYYYRPRVYLPVSVTHQLIEDYTLEKEEEKLLKQAILESQMIAPLPSQMEQAPQGETGNNVVDINKMLGD